VSHLLKNHILTSSPFFENFCNVTRVSKKSFKFNLNVLLGPWLQDDVYNPRLLTEKKSFWKSRHLCGCFFLNKVDFQKRKLSAFLTTTLFQRTYCLKSMLQVMWSTRALDHGLVFLSRRFVGTHVTRLVTADRLHEVMHDLTLKKQNSVVAINSPICSTCFCECNDKSRRLKPPLNFSDTFFHRWFLKQKRPLGWFFCIALK